MPFDPSRHHRRSIRLPSYDYASPGWYFVTLCTHTRRPLFADPVLRAIAHEQLARLGSAGARGARPGRVSVDAAVVMDDHTHLLIVIADAPGAARRPRDTAEAGGLHVDPGSLGAVVRSYKAAVARRANAFRHTPGAPIWQRGYYERVLRDARGVAAVRRYIAENPARHAARALELLLGRMQLRQA